MSEIDPLLQAHNLLPAQLAELEASTGDPRVTEVKVWGSGMRDIAPGESGAIHTEGLNGCHVSIITGKDGQGKRTLALTHFPPSYGKDGYMRSLGEISEAMKLGGVEVDGIVSVVDERRYPAETEALGEVFAGVPVSEVPYNSRDKGRAYFPGKGEVFAAIDYSQEQAALVVATEAGMQEFALAGVSQ
ncbi:MAG: hypothetical protein JWO41_79 [Candidatus Saccharibacteria bacterium]|nr:hypothetical protein [Candidatus Saccharibacteria bacterium]